MTSVIGFWGPHFFGLSYESKPWGRVKARSLSNQDALDLSSDSVVTNGVSVSGEKHKVKKKRKIEDGPLQSLEPLWDDGYGTVTVKDYFYASEDTIKPDGGPPRWFCPLALDPPLRASPVLLFLPGLDGTGWGLISHHKALQKFFEVRCLHIPVNDQTPFEGLVKLVEETIRTEHASSPNKPIYLVGECFGGCLSLAVAARNPTIDLVLVLVNPATSIERSQLQPLFPLLEAVPEELHATLPYLFSFVIGDPAKMATVNINNKLPPGLKLMQMSQNLTDLLNHLSSFPDIIPKETFLWKLKLLKSAAGYANSRLHAVKAEVLVLASGKDNTVPSRDEADRLKSLLQNCTVCHFPNNGHALLLEDGVNLLTVIKRSLKYRRSRKHDNFSDFLPPSLTEFNNSFDGLLGVYRFASFASGAVFLSTLEDGTVVRGLTGVPNEGPVLLVGYHNLLGLEVIPLLEEFLREKKIMVRVLTHPELLIGKYSDVFEDLKLFGAVPVSVKNLYKSLSSKSHVLLYPGGVREVLHYKGEDYKLFWPEQAEFVRMAARFGATIVPFGAVGQDDLVELALDYSDIKKIPVVGDFVINYNNDAVQVRKDTDGEVANEALYVPGVLPKLPGRYYHLFGKPIVTKGREDILNDKDNADQLYSEIQSEIKRNLAYLLKKREEDPYRNVIDRTVYRALYSPLNEVPTFEP